MLVAQKWKDAECFNPVHWVPMATVHHINYKNYLLKLSCNCTQLMCLCFFLPSFGFSLQFLSYSESLFCVIFILDPWSFLASRSFFLCCFTHFLTTQFTQLCINNRRPATFNVIVEILIKYVQLYILEYYSLRIWCVTVLWTNTP